MIGVFLAAVSAVLNALLLRRKRPALWAALTLWTTLSLSTEAADAIGFFTWCPGVSWVRALGFLWFVLTVPVLLARWLAGVSRGETDLARRGLLRAGAGAAVAAPFGGVAFAIRQARQEAEVREIDVAIPDLPQDLRGLRLVQISDIHLSPFFSRDELRRVIDAANGLRGDLGMITGDLITSSGDPLHDALDELARLRTSAGIYGCLGNHEIVAEAEEETACAGRRRGILFLRQQAQALRFGQASLNIAGVDYQRKSRAYLQGAGALHRSDSVNLLLSHNPDVFPVAAKQHWDLTLAGHTHGGQVTLEYLHPALNPARFHTPFVYGLYRQTRSFLYVTRGLGTVGIPARLGATPEIALIRLV